MVPLLTRVEFSFRVTAVDCKRNWNMKMPSANCYSYIPVYSLPMHSLV